MLEIRKLQVQWSHDPGKVLEDMFTSSLTNDERHYDIDSRPQHGGRHQVTGDDLTDMEHIRLFMTSSTATSQSVHPAGAGTNHDAVLSDDDTDVS